MNSYIQVKHHSINGEQIDNYKFNNVDKGLIEALNRVEGLTSYEVGIVTKIKTKGCYDLQEPKKTKKVNVVVTLEKEVPINMDERDVIKREEKELRSKYSDIKSVTPF